MLDPKRFNQTAANEAVVEEQFKKLNYLVERLDRKSSKRPRPDFLISDSTGPQMLCEVKTVASGGYPRDKNVHGVGYVHVSTQDDEFRGPFRNIPIDLSKIDNRLADAVRKRKALVDDNPSFKDLPLLVAFFFDPLAEYLPFYPRSFDERDERFREVSGILTIEEHIIDVPKSFEKLSEEEQRQFLRSAVTSPNRKDFVLVRNKAARRVVPPAFQLRCITEGYDESI